VTIRGRLGVDRPLKIEIPDKTSWAEIEVAENDLKELAIRLSVLPGAVGIYVDTERVCDTNGVSDLNKCAVTEVAGYERLGDPPGGVCCATIDLSWVLSGEGSTSMGSPSSVCVDDDLATSKAGVAMGSTTGEASARVEMVDGVLVKVLGWDDLADDLFFQLSRELFLSDVGAMLGRDEDGVDAKWGEFAVLVFVLDGDLGLSVGADLWTGSVLSDLSELEAELGCKRVGEGHEILAFVGGIAEHVALVTGSNIFDVLVDVDGVGDLGGLLLKSDDNLAGLVVASFVSMVVADLLESVADNLLVVYGCLGGDFTENHDHIGLGTGLTCNSGIGVLGQTGIKDCVRNLITQFIRVSFVDTL